MFVKYKDNTVGTSPVENSSGGGFNALTFYDCVSGEFLCTRKMWDHKPDFGPAEWNLQCVILAHLVDALEKQRVFQKIKDLVIKNQNFEVGYFTKKGLGD